MDGGELNAAAGSNVSKIQVNSDGIMNVEAGATVNTVAINDGTLNLKTVRQSAMSPLEDISLPEKMSLLTACL